MLLVLKVMLLAAEVMLLHAEVMPLSRDKGLGTRDTKTPQADEQLAVRLCL